MSAVQPQRLNASDFSYRLDGDDKSNRIEGKVAIEVCVRWFVRRQANSLESKPKFYGRLPLGENRFNSIKTRRELFPERVLEL